MTILGQHLFSGLSHILSQVMTSVYLDLSLLVLEYSVYLGFPPSHPWVLVWVYLEDPNNERPFWLTQGSPKESFPPIIRDKISSPSSHQ
jgi:hypothetical protein